MWLSRSIELSRSRNNPKRESVVQKETGNCALRDVITGEIRVVLRSKSQKRKNLEKLTKEENKILSDSY
jgi:hypothetical protein